MSSTETRGPLINHNYSDLFDKEQLLPRHIGQPILRPRIYFIRNASYCTYLPEMARVAPQLPPTRLVPGLTQGISKDIAFCAEIWIRTENRQ